MKTAGGQVAAHNGYGQHVDHSRHGHGVALCQDGGQLEVGDLQQGLAVMESIVHEFPSFWLLPTFCFYPSKCHF